MNKNKKLEKLTRANICQISKLKNPLMGGTNITPPSDCVVTIMVAGATKPISEKPKEICKPPGW